MTGQDLVQKGLPCPDQKDCGSSNAFAVYADGHGHCFSGNHPEGTRTYSAARLVQLAYDHRLSDAVAGRAQSATKPTGAVAMSSSLSGELEDALKRAKVSQIASRKITKETAAFCDYRVRKNGKNELEELSPYRDDSGSLLGIHVRNLGADLMGKDFYVIGSVTGLLWGRHQYGPGQKRTDGKPSWVLITEGQHDRMACIQSLGTRYTIVSVPQGTDSAALAIKKNLEWLLTHDRVILGFDQDKAGRDCTEECVKLLPPGRAWIAKWAGAKDASELLVSGRGEDITRAVWNPSPWRPDGVLDARTLTDACKERVTRGLPWPWEGMNDWSMGRRPGEAHEFGAGTGVGKTDIIATIVACTISGETLYGETFTPESVAVMSYEADAVTTKKYVASKLAHRMFHLPQEWCPAGFAWTDEELAAVLERMDGPLWETGGKLFINDSYGAADWEEVKSRWRYLAKAEGVKHFVLDPVGAMALGQDDERKILDKVSLEFTTLMQELSVTGYLCTHLTRPEGSSHEEGGRVSLKQFRGSNGLVMYIPFIYGAERNSQAEDIAERMTTTLRALKLRGFGFNVGKTIKLHYDTLTGTIEEPAVDMKDQMV